MTDAPQPSPDDLATHLADVTAQLALAHKRHARERSARKQAESLLEARARELFEANERLEKLNSELEDRVARRTQELNLAREKALALAERDQLTGLANRRSFLRRLDLALQETKHTNQQIAILSIDLDFFKDVNDSLGHQAGDELLKQVAQRLGKLVRSTDLVARLGGDEFAILCPIKQNQDEVAFIADRVIDALEEPVCYEGVSLEVGCSIGVAISQSAEDNSQDLQRYADIALYSTKESGRGDWSIYEDSMGESVRERQKLCHHLRQALEHHADGLEIRYQPIIDQQTGTIFAVEALCRWTDPVMGSINPDSFIPIAEETSLIFDLGDYVLNRSCHELKDWLASNNAHLSINLSPKQLKDPNLLSRIRSTIETHAIDPSRLCFEVTESLFLWDISEARNRLNELSTLGAKIALDDFGTGFSNLSQLRFLPVDFLKIDRSFVSDIEHDARALAMVHAILAVANSMQIHSIAEGVESQHQADLIEKAGGSLLQGYHFAKALPVKKLLQYASDFQSTASNSLSKTG